MKRFLFLAYNETNADGLNMTRADSLLKATVRLSEKTEPLAVRCVPVVCQRNQSGSYSLERAHYN
jgi:hypothetical protein